MPEGSWANIPSSKHSRLAELGRCAPCANLSSNAEKVGRWEAEGSRARRPRRGITAKLALLFAIARAPGQGGLYGRKARHDHTEHLPSPDVYKHAAPPPPPFQLVGHLLVWMGFLGHFLLLKNSSPAAGSRAAPLHFSFFLPPPSASHQGQRESERESRSSSKDAGKETASASLESKQAGGRRGGGEKGAGMGREKEGSQAVCEGLVGCQSAGLRERRDLRRKGAQRAGRQRGAASANAPGWCCSRRPRPSPISVSFTPCWILSRHRQQEEEAGRKR